MAAYTGQQRFLLQAAQKYSELGYKVGLAKGKTFLQDYEPDTVVMSWWGPVRTQSQNPDSFDGISLIPLGIVCVDIDIPDFGVVYEALPPTLKERTPRGWHLWYSLPDFPEESPFGKSYYPKIKWRAHVDLLTKGKPAPLPKKSRYKNTTGGPDHWGEHILVSPTAGYSRIWPDEMPNVKDLTEAPQWLLDALEKP
jgi:hypothetical protein